MEPATPATPAALARCVIKACPWRWPASYGDGVCADHAAEPIALDPELLAAPAGTTGRARPPGEDRKPKPEPKRRKPRPGQRPPVRAVSATA